ncbi:hypothetical protein HK103_006190 [Boothiomyces macroporosus]|uniref:Coiled-coil domain-containing protein n=1 Tax=Boothiomyces macroporosus TaxID=261099 RepID=A0AAD5UHY2_9FUNG|nr:hypothetical protein HK103_006190 [Boothiomyces macroporosus]
MELSPKMKHHFNTDFSPNLIHNRIHPGTPSVQSVQLYSPEILKDAIESLGRLEIDKEHESFVNWLSSKQHLKEKIKKRPNLLTVERLQDFTEEELDLLIKQLQKNRNTFEKWLKTKNQIKRKQEEMAKRAKERQIEKAKLEQERMEKKKELTNEKVKEWCLSKQLDQMIEKQKQEKEKLKQEFVKQAKTKLNQEAFNGWIQSKKHSAPSHQPPKNIKPWVNEPLKPRKSSESVLSPPNLYSDYSMYMQNCPEYFKKYGLLVASGGNSSSPPSEEAKPVKKRKMKPAKPLFVVRKS